MCYNRRLLFVLLRDVNSHSRTSFLSLWRGTKRSPLLQFDRKCCFLLFIAIENTFCVLPVVGMRRTFFAFFSESFSPKQEGVGGRQKKAKHPREQLFTSSLCSFVPLLPSAAFGSESALVLLAVTVCQGANRFLLTGASRGQV